jgi:hypothetical protein
MSFSTSAVPFSTVDAALGARHPVKKAPLSAAAAPLD